MWIQLVWGKFGAETATEILEEKVGVKYSAYTDWKLIHNVQIVVMGYNWAIFGIRYATL